MQSSACLEVGVVNLLLEGQLGGDFLINPHLNQSGTEVGGTAAPVSDVSCREASPLSVAGLDQNIGPPLEVGGIEASALNDDLFAVKDRDHSIKTAVVVDVGGELDDAKDRNKVGVSHAAIIAQKMLDCAGDVYFHTVSAASVRFTRSAES